MPDRQPIQVFVGSPDDVKKEREQAFKIIEKLDYKYRPKGWRLEGVGWDKTHYSRIAWLSPQKAINSSIPRPSECDIAVFIFWRRIGTQLPSGSFEPNGAGEQPTGSLWEFYDAMEAGRPGCREAGPWS